MKRRLKISLIVLVSFSFIIILVFLFLYYGKSDTLNLIINDIDLSNISDGSYIGSYNKGRFSCKVEVIVKDKKIENIKILNKPVISIEEITQEIINRVLEKQSLKIDVVTGATASSKAILKAVENALIK